MSCIGLFSIGLFFKATKRLEILKLKRPKKKAQRKRWLREKHKEEKKKNRQLRQGIILILVGGLLLGGGMYARYYEQTNLSSTDGTIMVQTYFITNEVNKQLVDLQNGTPGEEKKEKLMELSSLLASYGSSSPSSSLSTEGQQSLNRYYVQLREFGTNLYSLTIPQLNNEDTLSAYLEDLVRIKQTQKKVFKQFSVNEDALKQKK
ncbi:YccF domain-containing protein [Enterococcus rivorum]